MKATRFRERKTIPVGRQGRRRRTERVGALEALQYLTKGETKVLRDLRARLRDLLGDRLKAMILFGSKARGDFDPDSDLDVAVIVEGLDRALKRKVIDVVVELEVERLIPFTSLVLSPEEFAALRSRERRIALDIESEGILL